MARLLTAMWRPIRLLPVDGAPGTAAIMREARVDGQPARSRSHPGRFMRLVTSRPSPRTAPTAYRRFSGAMSSRSPANVSRPARMKASPTCAYEVHGGDHGGQVSTAIGHDAEAAEVLPAELGGRRTTGEDAVGSAGAAEDGGVHYARVGGRDDDDRALLAGEAVQAVPQMLGVILVRSSPSRRSRRAGGDPR